MDSSAKCHSIPAQGFHDAIVEGAGAAPPWRPRILALLVLVCLAPRLWEAYHWAVLWVDTLLDLDASDAILQGDFEPAPEETHRPGRNAWAESRIVGRLGYRRIPARELPSRCRELRVFVRPDKSLRSCDKPRDRLSIHRACEGIAA